MKKFTLVGTQRSGTTFIRHCLNSHNEILCHGELFFKNYPDDVGYYNFKKKAVSGGIRHLFFRPAIVKEFLDKYYSKPGYQAIGYKLMYSQVRWIPYSFPSAIAYIKNNSLGVVHVIRENVLKTFLSREVARKRKVYHAKSKTSIEKVDLDVDSLLAELKKIQAENSWWSRMFSEGDYISISYESFVANKEIESRRLLKFLGVGNYQELVSSNVKITSDTLSDVIGNYSEVARCLDSSEFAFCLHAVEQ